MGTREVIEGFKGKRDLPPEVETQKESPRVGTTYWKGDVDWSKVDELIREKSSTYKEAARKMGIDPAQLWRLLDGQSRTPQISTIKRISKYLGVSTKSLYLKEGVGQSHLGGDRKEKGRPVR